MQGSFNILQSVMLEIRQDVSEEDDHEQHRKPVAPRRPPEYHHTRAKDTQSSQTSSSMLQCAQVRTNQPGQLVWAFLSAFRGWGRWIWVQGKPGLQREFQNYQKYIEKVSQVNQNKQTKKSRPSLKSVFSKKLECWCQHKTETEEHIEYWT